MKRFALFLFLIIGILVAGIVIIFTISTPDKSLAPNAQANYTIKSHKTSLEPRTELHVQVISGSDLLLKGRDVWIVAPDSNGTIAYSDTQYFYDVEKQVVSVFEIDKNGEIIDKEVSPDAVEGIKLHKDGIVLTSKKARIFEL